MMKKEKTYIDMVEAAVDLYNEIYKEDGFIMVMDILNETFEEYMKDKCYECGIEYSAN